MYHTKKDPCCQGSLYGLVMHATYSLTRSKKLSGSIPSAPLTLW